MNRRNFFQIGTVGCGAIGGVFSYLAIRNDDGSDGKSGHEVSIQNDTDEPITVALAIESGNGKVEWEEVNTLPTEERVRRDTDLTANEYMVTAEFAQGETLTDSYTATQEWYYSGCGTIPTSIYRPHHFPEDNERPIDFRVVSHHCD